RLAVRPACEPLLCALDHGVEQAEDDVDLAPEVVEERAQRDLDLVGDLRERRLLVALLEEEARRDLDDRLSRPELLSLAESDLHNRCGHGSSEAKGYGR